MRKPQDYWQDRIIQADGAIVELAKILHAHFLAMRPELEWFKHEFNRVRDELESAYPDEADKLSKESSGQGNAP